MPIFNTLAGLGCCETVLFLPFHPPHPWPCLQGFQFLSSQIGSSIYLQFRHGASIGIDTNVCDCISHKGCTYKVATQPWGYHQVSNRRMDIFMAFSLYLFSWPLPLAFCWCHMWCHPCQHLNRRCQQQNSYRVRYTMQLSDWRHLIHQIARHCAGGTQEKMPRTRLKSSTSR